MQNGPEIQQAVTRAVAFLERAQLPSGELPVHTTTDPDMRDRLELDPSIFPTALAVYSLTSAPEASGVVARACDFLCRERDPDGLWRHWTRDHAHFASLPPDLDDTGCVSLALQRAGRLERPPRGLLLANRARSALFYTWFVLRPRWTGASHMRIVVRQLRHLPTLIAFFYATSAKPFDIDACGNASALHLLAPFAGDEKVAVHLLEVLKHGHETQCDKWYDNAFVVRYFLSRALRSHGDDARSLVVERTRAEAPKTALDNALAACVLMDWGEDPRDFVAALLSGQDGDGSWPAAAVYYGGRKRRRSGGFYAPHPDTPRWGSAALTTAFAIEALSRYMGAPD